MVTCTPRSPHLVTTWSEAWGSILQPESNVAILIAVGAIGLLAQRRLWRRIGRRARTA
jgi:hypothetical protein